MITARPLHALAALLLTASAVMAAPQATAVLSYRDAYRAMVVFEKYGKPKQLIQNQLQVVPRQKGASLDGVQLSVSGKLTQINLPLDGVGRAVFPLLKAAYDENAALVLNRDAGQFTLRARVSITPRADGVYELAELRAACEQVLAFQRYADPSRQGGQCVGVRLSYAPQSGEPKVRLRKGDGDALALPVSEGSAFHDETGARLRVVDVRFDATRGQLLSASVPVAIAATID